MNGKIAGTSVIAYAVVAFLASHRGFFGGILTCNLGAIFLLILGSAVYKVSWRACAFAIFFSAIDFISATANVVAVAKYGVVEVGAWTFYTALVFTPWTLLNLALLIQFRGVQRQIAELRSQSPMAILDPPPRAFQFSLRSMFILTVLVALASAIGSRPLPTSESWNMGWATSQTRWHVQVLGYHSGRPVIGSLSKAQGADLSGRRQLHIFLSLRSSYIDNVGGVAIQPSSEDFQLFVNDLHNNPMRLVIPMKDAMKIFGRNLDKARIEKFWSEVVEPARKKTAAAHPDSSAFGGQPRGS
jgi:hypothetical protein